MRGLHFLSIYYFLCLYKWFDALGNWTRILAGNVAQRWNARSNVLLVYMPL